MCNWNWNSGGLWCHKRIDGLRLFMVFDVVRKVTKCEELNKHAANYRLKVKGWEQKETLTAWIDSSTQLLHFVYAAQLLGDALEAGKQYESVVWLFLFFIFSENSLMRCDFSHINEAQVFSLFALTMRDVCSTVSKETTVSSLADLGRACFGHRYTHPRMYSVSVHWVCDSTQSGGVRTATSGTSSYLGSRFGQQSYIKP